MAPAERRSCQACCPSPGPLRWPPPLTPPRSELRPRASARAALQELDQLAGLLALLFRVAPHDRVFDAVAEVALQQLAFDPRQRRADGPKLGHDVDAIAILLDHPRRPAPDPRSGP